MTYQPDLKQKLQDLAGTCTAQGSFETFLQPKACFLLFTKRARRLPGEQGWAEWG